MSTALKDRSTNSLPATSGAAPNKKGPMRFSFLGFLSGGLLTSGSLVLMQQYGRAALTTGQIFKAVGGAVLFGLVVPTIIRAVVSSRKAPALGLIPLVAAAAFVSLGSAPALAQSTCSLSVNGQTVSSGSNIVVAEGTDLSVSFQGTDITSGSAAVMVGPITARTESFKLDAPKSGSVDETVAYDTIAQYGIGTFEVSAAIQGESGDCAYDFTIEVQGDPLSTPLGKAAAGMTALGGLGAVFTVSREVLSALAAAKLG